MSATLSGHQGAGAPTRDRRRAVCRRRRCKGTGMPRHPDGRQGNGGSSGSAQPKAALGQDFVYLADVRTNSLGIIRGSA